MELSDLVELAGLDELAERLGVGGFKQSNRLFRLITAWNEGNLAAETLEGFEALGEGGFRFVVTALSTSTRLDLQAPIGQPLLIELETDQAPRYFHGHVTGFERLGSNGGVTRYRLTLEPWLAFLRLRHDSFLFQDATVVEIVESMFADYADQGALAPAWRWELENVEAFPRYSTKTQYQESDFTFLHRLLTAEGISYRFEHEGAPDSETLGKHVLVLSNHNGAFPDLGELRFHRRDVTERRDSVQHFAVTQRWRPNTRRLASWDYAMLTTRSAEYAVPPAAAGIDLLREGCLPYGYATLEQGERRAQIELQALRVNARTASGAGSVRALHAGARFTLAGHPRSDANRAHLCTRVVHRASNNFGGEIVGKLEQATHEVLTPPRIPQALQTDDSASHIPPEDQGTAFYDNTFETIPASRFYVFRLPFEDAQGRPCYPTPRIDHQQTAIVVGAEGAAIETDRDHRVRVQFHWQRGAKSASRLAHPSADDNAPANSGSGTWVRVMTPLAGSNYGGNFLPRIGQEVLIDFLDGDPDRPVVTGTLYNGAGAKDAQINQQPQGAARATGNAPSWFAGEQEGHAHPALMEGIKTQALSKSQDGSGGYNQLVFDSTPGQSRLELSTTQTEARLQLGHLKHQLDNELKNPRGHGVELATLASGAIRAGAGLLLSSEPGNQALDATSAEATLAASQRMVQNLAGIAQHQQAQLPKEAAPEKLPVVGALAETLTTLAATQDFGAIPIGGSGEVRAWQEPHLIASSPAGITALTPAASLFTAGHSFSLTGGQDINLLSQGDTSIAVANGISFFTIGKVTDGKKPNQETGIALHAGKGQLVVQAQSDVATLMADKAVNVTSTTADVLVTAPQSLLLTAQGAFIKIENGHITLGGPGEIKFHAAMKELTGAKANGLEPIAFAKPALKGCGAVMGAAAGSGGAFL